MSLQISSRLFSTNLPIIFKRFSTKMSKKALVFLGEGAEEIEAVVAIDVLRRGGVDVTVAGLSGNKTIKCSRAVNIVPDLSVEEASSKGPYDVLVLPGGLGGTEAMIQSKQVGELLKEQEKSGRLIAAICAAPTALKAHGIGLGKKVTSYPAMEAKMTEGGQYQYSQDEVVVDDQLITSRGPGTAFKFSLKLLETLQGEKKAQEVAKAMLL